VLAFSGISSQLTGCYVLQQGWAQVGLLAQRQSVATVLADPNTSTEVSEKLRLIRRAKAYAEDVVGLRPTRNYEAYVPLDRDAVTYVVSAAPKDRLEPHQWWFPVVGHVPYKGFFAREAAVAEQAALDAAGLDTSLRGVAAFSMLGFLPDPVYQPFLNYSPVTLVNVIIHETTHATVFLSGQASFNEGFATFVGNRGVLDYFQAQGPVGEASYREALAAQQGARAFSALIKDVTTDLRALYASERSREEKLQAREGIFQQARRRFSRELNAGKQGFQFRHFVQGRINNASLLSYQTYYDQLDDFERAHARLGGSLRETVRFFKEVVARQADPAAYLQRWLDNGFLPAAR
jgi:predicted aminopeptidase